MSKQCSEQPSSLIGYGNVQSHRGRTATQRLYVMAAMVGVIGGVSAPAQKAADPLFARFQNPPQDARPRVWWHWMNGNVSQAGAELDLAWMKRIGIGGVHTFSGALLEPTVVSPPVPFMSDEWKRVFRTTTAEARKSGMEVTIAGSPGWSETGGVWVAPEDAMKKFVWSETSVEGGTPFTGKLTATPSITGPFQALKRKASNHVPVELTHDVYKDTVVVAFPTPAAASQKVVPKVTSNSAQFVSSLVTAYGVSMPVALSVDDGEPLFIQAAYPSSVPVHAVTLGLAAAADVEIQAAASDGTFSTVVFIPADQSEQPAAENTFSFPVVRTTTLRIVLTPVAPLPPPVMPRGSKLPRPKSVLLTRVAFHTVDRINRFEAKAGFTSTVDFSRWPTSGVDASGIVASKEVIDLTSQLRADGTLDWTPPAGHWTVLRFGYSLTGQTNAPAENPATGLEVDKLDATLVRNYMEHYLSLYRDASGDRLGDAGVQNVLTDSWEAGVQNWTPSMLAQFKERRGYDAIAYLPALAGWVVDGANVSDRFLWDFHRTLKDMLADNHYGTLARVMHKHHMGYYTEAEGDYPRAIGDGMTMKSRSDIPTGEFWYRPFSTDPGQPPLQADLDESASTAHVYGKRYAAAESLTVGAFSDPWSFSPAMLKPVADEIFAHGINRILVHESHHQPFLDKKPGLELGLFGQYFNRNDTWAEQAKPWVDYLARTSFMLQQGQYVADVAYFYGEDRNLSEIYLHRFNSDVPAGYAYDYINPEALMQLLNVQGGRIVTPSGMSYRVLYLPPYVDRLTLPALQKLRDLVSAGAIVAGSKPKGGLGLNDDDRQIRELANMLWGDDDSQTTAHSLGAGRVYRTSNLADVLKAEGARPDIKMENARPESKLMTLHRHAPGLDIYFISNQRNQPEDLIVETRTPGEAPAIWHAETGKSELASFHANGNTVDTTVHLAPDEAIFLVFRPARNRSASIPALQRSLLRSLAAPWSVQFEAGRGAPPSASFPSLLPWNESADPGIKYFSGHATYTQSLTLPSSFHKPHHRVLLNLGEVREIAEVSVNGSAWQTVWHGPYELDVTDKLKAGRNTVAIRVTNLWPNRLIGDKQPGATKYTYAPQSPYGASSTLLRSGLMGPVSLFETW